jgi:hypothetical protein
MNKIKLLLIIFSIITIILVVYVQIKTLNFVELLNTCKDEFNFIETCKCYPKGVDWRI